MESPDFQSREQDRIETTVIRCIGKQRIVTISAEKFAGLDAVAKETDGISLGQMAKSSPEHAYAYIRHMLATLASRHAVDMSIDGMIVTDSDLEGAEVARTIAEQEVFNILPPEWEDEFDLRLQVFPTSEDVEMGLADPINVLELKSTAQ